MRHRVQMFTMVILSQKVCCFCPVINVDWDEYLALGATVISNTWSDSRFQVASRYWPEPRAISQDEKRYPDPSRFMPERFLNCNGALTNDDPAGYIFGLGRRICPGRSSHIDARWHLTNQHIGRHVADASLWSAMVTMLATVDISFPKDPDGKVINFIPKFSTGLTRYLVFWCSSVLLLLIISLVTLSPSLATFHHALIFAQNCWTNLEQPCKCWSGSHDNMSFFFLYYLPWSMSRWVHCRELMSTLDLVDHMAYEVKITANLLYRPT